MKRILFITCLLALLASCNQASKEAAAPAADSKQTTEAQAPEATSATDSAYTELDEVFITPSREADNVDSIGIWQSSEGQVWSIITAKATDKLLVYNGVDGAAVREVGQTGTGAGDLDRPNGIQVIDDLCVVVERDNKRVQIFSLPEFKHLGFIGGDVLRKPYGLSVYKDEADTYQLYVTDDYPATPEDAEMPGAFYTERIKHFSFKVTDEQLTEVQFVRQFGEAEGQGRLWVVESIIADPEKGRIYIADEEGPSVGIKVYDLDGKYTGQMLDTATFKGQPEGIAIYQNGARSYLITTDQQPSVSVFHIFDRETLKPIAAFKGKTTANTDGISVHGSVGFTNGGLWAIHDDQALVAFDWDQIQALLP